MSEYTVERYIKNKVTCPFVVWRFSWPYKSIPVNKNLRIELLTAAMFHRSLDNWETSQNAETTDTKLGIYLVDINLKKADAEEIQFTFFWKKANH